MKISQPARPDVSVEDFNRAVAELQAMAPTIRKEAGPGAFLHPHEILGCSTDQMAKLTTAVTASVYSGEAGLVKQRCLKFAYALLFAAASLEVTAEK